MSTTDAGPAETLTSDVRNPDLRVVEAAPTGARLLVVAARPDVRGLEAARCLAARCGGEAAHGGEAGLEERVRAADRVLVVDPSRLRARLTSDPAFTAPAPGTARRALLARLAPHRARVRWLTGPE